MKLRSSILEVQHLTSADRDQMYSLMLECYENIPRDRFESDLDAKWRVIQVREPLRGRLVGFSTQVLLETLVDQKPIVALFSGDTVVQPQYWGDMALAHEWGQLALRLIDQRQSDRLYWFLTSKGFRTYRYLPLFFRQYFPRWRGPSDDDLSTIVDALGPLIAGNRYDPLRRIIAATPDKDYVKQHAADPQQRAQHDPHVRFFFERNPGYDRGDELCCVAPLARHNFTRAAYRVINANLSDAEAV